MRHCKARTCESPIPILLVARIYRVIQELISIFLEEVVSVIVGKIIHLNMRLIIVIEK